MDAAHNKAFKRDSQRSAVLVLIGFGVYGAMTYLGRYALFTP
ncbi:hypothetical protein XE88_u0038 [Vibrio parahaemolyticus]|nr:hypothetical protein XE88_u0038 [Vibrio parahaemolyticus]